MNWLTPVTGLIVAACVIPPLVLLYFLKLRRRPQPIASTLLWKRAVEDLRANALFQRLRPSVLLLLQLLILLALAAALAQPQIDAGRRDGGRTVILIDNSASMTATDGEDGMSRLEVAKKAAKARVETLHAGGLFGGSPGQIMVVAFSDRAEIRCPFTDSKAQVLEAIETIRPTHGASRVGQALELARAYTTNLNPDLTDRPIAEAADLELFSDGRIQDLQEQVLKGEKLRFESIGDAKTGNLSITHIAADRPYEQPGQIQVFAALANFGLEPREVDVQLSVDGVVKAITPKPTAVPAALLDEKTGVLTPGRARVVFLPFDQPSNVGVEVAILSEDALAADNIAHMIVPPAKRLRVALVGGDGFLIKTVLEGVALETLRLMSMAQFEELAQDPAALEAYDVIIFDNGAPKTVPPAGRYLSIGPTPPVPGLNEFGTGDRALVLSTRDEHPVMRYVNLDSLFIGELRKLAPSSEAVVLAETGAGPAIVEVRHEGSTILHVAFDPMESNWPFQRGFVNFIINAVEYLGGATETLADDVLRPGDALSDRLPLAAKEVRLSLPDGTTETLTPADPAQFTWGPIRLAGLYELSWDDPASSDQPSRKFAVAIDAEAEGRIDAAADVKFSEDVVKGVRGGSAVQTALWPWLLAAVLGIQLLEWWLYTKRTAV